MTRLRAEPRCIAFALAACALAAHAQQGATVQTSIGVTQGWTDNLRLTEDNKDAALVTTVSPGVRLVSNSGAVRGNLDYSLNGIAYVKSDQAARVQNALSATGQAELIARTLFVDARATIGQQSASAFGLQSAPTLGSQGSVSSLANANQRETGTLTVSPSLRGQLGSVATYELRGDFSRTDARGSSVGDSHSRGGSLRVNQANAGVAGWWVMATSQEVKANSVASNSNETLKLGLDYHPDVDWSFTLNAGRERNNYLGGGSQDGNTGGIASQWTPTERTQIGADWQYHNYGDSHGLNFTHRMAHSVWRLSDTVATTLGNTGASGGTGTFYDLYYLLFASVEPDPVKRDVLVRAYLQSQNLSPDAVASSGFLSAGPSRVHSQQLAITLQGVRSTLSALASRSVTSRLGSGLNAGDLANTSRVEQRSYSLTATHQLTPLSGLSLSVARQESRGDTAAQSTQLTSLLASWNARLGERLNLLLGARHSRFEGVTSYAENSVYASLTQQF
jgi:uncharacterized protein (PEP-CTERM system associated)